MNQFTRNTRGHLKTRTERGAGLSSQVVELRSNLIGLSTGAVWASGSTGNVLRPEDREEPPTANQLMSRYTGASPHTDPKIIGLSDEKVVDAVQDSPPSSTRVSEAQVVSWKEELMIRRLVKMFTALSIASLAAGCVKRGPPGQNLAKTNKQSVETVKDQKFDRHDMPESTTECELPRLDARMQIDFGRRKQPGKALEAAWSADGSGRTGSLRPIFVDEARAKALEKQAPELRVKRRLFDRSITPGPRWFKTCDPAHPFALLRDIEILKSSMRTDFNKNGRNLEEMYRHCGGYVPKAPSGRQEDMILQHHLSEDRSRCSIEIRGKEDAARDSEMNDHVFRVMRSRIHKGELVFRTLEYRVPEQDWPYLADVVQKSAQSFEAVFDFE